MSSSHNAALCLLLIATLIGCKPALKRPRPVAQEPVQTAESDEKPSLSERYTLFMKLHEEAETRLYRGLCEARIVTKADALVEDARFRIQLISGHIWQESLKKASLTLEDFRAVVAANPKVFVEQIQAITERESQQREVCRKTSQDLPDGDLQAARLEVQTLYSNAEPIAESPLEGIDLEEYYLKDNNLKPPWLRNLDEGLERAADQKIPSLVFFDANWCAPCRILKTIMQGEPVRELIEGKFSLILLDVSATTTEENETLQALMNVNIGQLPITLILDFNGAEVTRYTERRPGMDSFLHFLDSAKK